MAQAHHDEGGEPDLTAMLDVVMQLLMYFIMCVNFIEHETTAEVLLPEATQAKPISKDDSDVLFMNVDKDGTVLILGEKPKDLIDTKIWLDNRATEILNKSSDKTIHTALI